MKMLVQSFLELLVLNHLLNQKSIYWIHPWKNELNPHILFLTSKIKNSILFFVNFY
jgi:hypothetical protein